MVLNQKKEKLIQTIKGMSDKNIDKVLFFINSFDLSERESQRKRIEHTSARRESF